MGRRVVHECDLSKLEYDPEDTVKITIKRKNKTSKSYEISVDTADKLETQLSPAGEPLESDWSFTAMNVLPAEESLAPTPVENMPSPAERRKALEEADPDGDDDKLAGKIKRQHKDRIKEEKDKPKKASGSSQITVNRQIQGGDPDCSHMNRTRPQMTITEDDKRYAYTNCLDCGAEIPIKTHAERARLNNMKAPAGTRVKN
jgi:hypothetical protein